MGLNAVAYMAFNSRSVLFLIVVVGMVIGSDAGSVKGVKFSDLLVSRASSHGLL